MALAHPATGLIGYIQFASEQCAPEDLKAFVFTDQMQASLAAGDVCVLSAPRARAGRQSRQPFTHPHTHAPPSRAASTSAAPRRTN